MEKVLVTAGVRLIGLWWIFYDAGSHLYYIIIKHSGLITTSTIPVAYNEQSAIYDVIFGVLVILVAPIIALAIFGADQKPATTPAERID